MRLLSLLFLIFAVNAPALALENAETTPAPHPAPQWFLDDIDFLTRDGGRWVASNADYQSESEPMEAFVMEWKADYANSITGRLYGMIDGEPTQDFWRFRQYWHPGEGKAVLEQFGIGGAFGIGSLWPEDGSNKLLQTFYAPGGGAAEQGHKATNPDADTHVTTSFDVVGDEWTERRRYTWKRDKTTTEEKS